jgi:hypothetical protein
MDLNIEEEDVFFLPPEEDKIKGLDSHLISDDFEIEVEYEADEPEEKKEHRLYEQPIEIIDNHGRSRRRKKGNR